MIPAGPSSRPAALLILLLAASAAAASCVRLGFRPQASGGTDRGSGLDQNHPGDLAVADRSFSDGNADLGLAADGRKDRWGFSDRTGDVVAAPADLRLPDQLWPDQPPLVPPTGWAALKPATFTMGSPGTEPCRSSFESARQVTLTRAFYIARTETTASQFSTLMGYNPSSTTCSNCPVTNVSWHEAVAYCNALSKAELRAPCYECAGAQAAMSCVEAPAYSGSAVYDCPGYRLPTEAEWELAYRAGTSTPYYNGANDPALCWSCASVDALLGLIATYCANSGNQVAPVGQKQPNQAGLYDMAGNVWEWCHEDFATIGGTTPVVDPVAPPSGSNSRAVRGGAFSMPPVMCRAAARISDAATDRYPDLGFRCVRTGP